MSDKDTIRVLLVKPMRPPEVVSIQHDLKSLQSVVGGCIEAVYPFADNVAVICNEEGKITGLPLNRALKDENGKMYDIIAGDFFVCDASGEDFGSLSDEALKKYGNIFRYPERFVRTPDGIAAIPVITPNTRHNNDAR